MRRPSFRHVALMALALPAGSVGCVTSEGSVETVDSAVDARSTTDDPTTWTGEQTPRTETTPQRADVAHGQSDGSAADSARDSGQPRADSKAEDVHVTRGEVSANDGEARSDVATPEASTTRPDVTADTPAAVDGRLQAITLFIAGDSTVQTYTDTSSPRDQAGWGQKLGAFFGASLHVDNRAIGGRTARRFIDEGRLTDLWADVHRGDYLLVQFGTNDGNRTATYTIDGTKIPYYLDPATSFKAYLKQYIDGARQRGVIPVLVTPPPRSSAYCTGSNGTGAHGQAMRELGADEEVAVVDLGKKTADHLRAICPAPTPETFFFIKADGSVDSTHFQENGARIMARFITEEVRRLDLSLAAYLR